MRLVIYCLLLLLSVPCRFVSAAEQVAPPVERDWLINLVDTLNLSFGLPEEPQDDDYQRLLDGLHHYRFEAEETRSANDLIGINAFTVYGAYSGSGWASGMATPTRLHMEFLLPRSGTYLMTASLRLGGQHFLIADQPLAAPTFNDQMFHKVSLGQVVLTAGPQTLAIELPPNSGIDYVDFDAIATAKIAPRDGWQPERPLTLDTLAVTAARLLAIEPLLPLDGSSLTFEAEELATLPPEFLSDQQHLGAPRGGRWIRAGAQALPITLNFTPPNAAVYDLVLRAAVDGRLTARLNNSRIVSAQFPIYLAEKRLGAFHLDSLPQQLSLELQPRTGIDTLTLRRHHSAPADYQRLVGLPTGNEQPASPTINRLLALLARLAAGQP